MSEFVPLGWVCARCGRVWAPGVKVCECAGEGSAAGERLATAGERLATAGGPVVWVESRTGDGGLGIGD